MNDDGELEFVKKKKKKVGSGYHWACLNVLLSLAMTSTKKGALYQVRKASCLSMFNEINSSPEMCDGIRLFHLFPILYITYVTLIDHCLTLIATEAALLRYIYIHTQYYANAYLVSICHLYEKVRLGLEVGKNVTMEEHYLLFLNY